MKTIQCVFFISVKQDICNSLIILIISTYILLCDLLVDVHVPQPKTQLTTLCNNSTIGGRSLTLQSRNCTGVLMNTKYRCVELY